MYDDRLEITSPGGLMSGLSIAQIKTGYSKIRNQAIAKVFTYLTPVESWGSGIPRVVEQIINAGLQEPKITLLEDAFRVEIYRNYYKKYDDSNSSTSVVEDVAFYDPQTDPQESTNAISEIIYREIAENSKITRAELARVCGVSESTIKRQLKKMINVKFIGSGYSGHWTIINNADKKPR